MAEPDGGVPPWQGNLVPPPQVAGLRPGFQECSDHCAEPLRTDMADVLVAQPGDDSPAVSVDVGEQSLSGGGEQEQREILLALGDPVEPADVTITATSQALTALIFAGSDTGVDITGETGPVQRFRQLIGTMATVVEPA